MKEVLERMIISCPTCVTRHESFITGNQSYVTFGEQTIQHMGQKNIDQYVNRDTTPSMRFHLNRMRTRLNVAPSLVSKPGLFVANKCASQLLIVAKLSY